MSNRAHCNFLKKKKEKKRERVKTTRHILNIVMHCLISHNKVKEMHMVDNLCNTHGQIRENYKKKIINLLYFLVSHSSSLCSQPH